MKTAVIALTPNGAALAAKVGRALPADIFVKSGRCAIDEVNCSEFTSLKALVADIFYRYDAILFIMASGIAVRMIAPYIVHKTLDPAIIVLDELGGHAVSLLSGHLGGANELTRRVAALIGAVPVITTATDVNQRPAADSIAARLGLRLGQIENLKRVNAAVAAGEEVLYYVDSTLQAAEKYLAALTQAGVRAVKTDAAKLGRDTFGVILADTELLADLPRALFLLPGRLTAGIGCRRGAQKEEILAALQAACRLIGKGNEDVVSLASTAVKSEESGLIAAARQMDIPLYFYGNEQIQAAIDGHHLGVSDFVYQQIGVGNICESTALLSSQSKKLALRKTKYPKVTVALAWEK